MKKIIMIFGIMFLFVGCDSDAQRHITEVYQNGVKVDEQCTFLGSSRTSWGGSYYKVTTRKCEVK